MAERDTAECKSNALSATVTENTRVSTIPFIHLALKKLLFPSTQLPLFFLVLVFGFGPALCTYLQLETKTLNGGLQQRRSHKNENGQGSWRWQFNFDRSQHEHEPWWEKIQVEGD